MNLRHLHHVLLLADALNFTRAAANAHLSQPAFSRSIAAAEAAAGMRLFDRTRRSVRPTAAGRRVIERGRELLRAAADLEREIGYLESGDTGEIRIGAGTTVASSLLPAVTRQFHALYPRVTLKIDVTHWRVLRDDLVRESIDFLIADTSELLDMPELKITALPKQRGSLFCRAGHPLLAGTLTRERLAAVDIAGPVLPRAVGQQLAALLGLPTTNALQLAIECNNMDVLREMATESDVVVLNLFVAMQSELGQGQVVDLLSRLPRRLLRSPEFYSEWGMVCLAGRTLSPPAERFMAMFQHAAQTALPSC